MLTWFDQMQQRLADEIDPTTNNVGHFIKEIYRSPQGFAAGGVAGSTNLEDAGEKSDIASMQQIANQAKKDTTGADGNTRYGDTALGQSFYNSPAYLMQHFSQLGKFFSGAEPGNKYNDRYAVPPKTQPVQAESPDDFYSRWYSKMRQFAEANEVVGAGSVEVRSR